MNTQFVGSHYVLSVLPVWASALIFYGVTMGVIYVTRDIFEGLPYQVAYSAQFGDTALAGAVLIAATILQRGHSLPVWLSNGYFHLLAAVIGVSVGIAWWSLDRPSHWADSYHHLFIAPLIVYLAITLVPVVLLNGTKVEKYFVVCFAVLWATLVVYDIKHDRTNQRQWLQDRGIIFKH
jgi:hypothetical protein